MGAPSKIAIPAFDDRVSPRFDCARTVLVLTMGEDRVEPERVEHNASDWPLQNRIAKLLEFGVDTVICGGIDRWSVGALQSVGITVYGWVAGGIEDALAALLQGDLDAAAAATEGEGRCGCRRFSADDPAMGTGRQRRNRGRHGQRGGEERNTGRGRRARLGARPRNTPNHLTTRGETSMPPTDSDSKTVEVIAVPIAEGRLCMHFGHCDQFTLIDVDTAGKEILNSRIIDPPPHQPGLLPRWLHEQGVTLVIAGGMGQRALGIFAEHGIEVVVGAPVASPESLIDSYFDGSLQTGENVCDH